MKRTRFILISFVFVIIIILRIFLEYIVKDNILKDLLITSLTAISFFIIILIISDNVYRKSVQISDKTKEKFGKELYKRNINEFKKKSLIINGILFIFLIIYIFLLRSNLLNDIITIMSLAISILENDLSNFITSKILY
ncbi:hypothetical protein ACSW8Q_13225 [Clostridium perfringens]